MCSAHVLKTCVFYYVVESQTELLLDDESCFVLPVFLQLNKRFILSFLHAHGKLFTKVGWVMFSLLKLLWLNRFEWRGFMSALFFFYNLFIYSMESFPGVASRVLQEFRTLLQHGPSLLGNTHMLQIITINMFTIYNAHSRGIKLTRAVMLWPKLHYCEVPQHICILFSFLY